MTEGGSPLVLVAMREERAPILSRAKKRGLVKGGVLAIGGRIVEVVQSGPGGLHMADAFVGREPSLVVHVGFCGAVDPDIELGSLHRLGATRLGPDLHEIPESELPEAWQALRGLLEQTGRTGPAEGRAEVGESVAGVDLGDEVGFLELAESLVEDARGHAVAPALQLPGADRAVAQLPDDAEQPPPTEEVEGRHERAASGGSADRLSGSGCRRHEVLRF